jgi:hypothetical protein
MALSEGEQRGLHQPPKLLQPSEEKRIGLCSASGVGCINYQAMAVRSP